MMQYPQNPVDIPRANKVGITFGATKIKRDKLKCYVSIAQGIGLSPRHKKDFLRFMTIVYKLNVNNPTGAEYQEIADSLGWSRDTVSIYANRAKERGLVEITKQLKRDMI